MGETPHVSQASRILAGAYRDHQPYRRMPDDLLTTEEVGALLGLTAHTVREYCRRRLIVDTLYTWRNRHGYLRRKRYIERCELEVFIAARRRKRRLWTLAEIGARADRYQVAIRRAASFLNAS